MCATSYLTESIHSRCNGSMRTQRFLLWTCTERSLTGLLRCGLHRIVCVLLFCCRCRPCGGAKWIQRFVIMTKSRDQTGGNNERHVCLTRLSVCCHSTSCLSASSFTLRWHKQSLIWPPLNQSQFSVSLIPGDSHWFDLIFSCMLIGLTLRHLNTFFKF